MKRIKMIFNLISLALTAGLLVVITMAWYAVNKTANVTAATGMVAAQSKLVEQVDYYNFSEKNENTNVYTIDDHIKDSGTCDMQEYTFPETKPTVYLIRIKLKNNKSISSLRFIS